MREREQRRHVVEDGLRALIAADSYQGASRAYPHLFVFARPGPACGVVRCGAM